MWDEMRTELLLCSCLGPWFTLLLSSTAARGSVVTLSTWAQHWQPGAVPRAQSLQRGSSSVGERCEMGVTAARLLWLCCLFLGSCWLKEKA